MENYPNLKTKTDNKKTINPQILPSYLVIIVITTHHKAEIFKSSIQEKKTPLILYDCSKCQVIIVKKKNQHVMKTHAWKT